MGAWHCAINLEPTVPKWAQGKKTKQVIYFFFFWNLLGKNLVLLHFAMKTKTACCVHIVIDLQEKKMNIGINCWPSVKEKH